MSSQNPKPKVINRFSTMLNPSHTHKNNTSFTHEDRKDLHIKYIEKKLEQKDIHTMQLEEKIIDLEHSLNEKNANIKEFRKTLRGKNEENEQLNKKIDSYRSDIERLHLERRAMILEHEFAQDRLRNRLKMNQSHLNPKFLKSLNPNKSLIVSDRKIPHAESLKQTPFKSISFLKSQQICNSRHYEPSEQSDLEQNAIETFLKNGSTVYVQTEETFDSIDQSGNPPPSIHTPISTEITTLLPQIELPPEYQLQMIYLTKRNQELLEQLKQQQTKSNKLQGQSEQYQREISNINAQLQLVESQSKKLQLYNENNSSIILRLAQTIENVEKAKRIPPTLTITEPFSIYQQEQQQPRINYKEQLLSKQLQIENMEIRYNKDIQAMTQQIKQLENNINQLSELLQEYDDEKNAKLAHHSTIYSVSGNNSGSISNTSTILNNTSNTSTTMSAASNTSNTCTTMSTTITTSPTITLNNSDKHTQIHLFFEEQECQTDQPAIQSEQVREKIMELITINSQLQGKIESLIEENSLLIENATHSAQEDKSELLIQSVIQIQITKQAPSVIETVGEQQKQQQYIQQILLQRDHFSNKASQLWEQYSKYTSQSEEEISILRQEMVSKNQRISDMQEQMAKKEYEYEQKLAELNQRLQEEEIGMNRLQQSIEQYERQINRLREQLADNIDKCVEEESIQAPLPAPPSIQLMEEISKKCSIISQENESIHSVEVVRDELEIELPVEDERGGVATNLGSINQMGALDDQFSYHIYRDSSDNFEDSQQQ